MKYSVSLFGFIICIIILTFLSGCTDFRYGEWAYEIFYQGEHVETYKECMEQYIRSVHMYSQLSTLAHFDALWLSDKVRSLYAYVHAEKHCFSQQEYAQLLDEQREENRRYISFYLLAAIGKSYGSIILTDDNAEWVVCLCVNGMVYKPVELKIVDPFDPEYMFFFGKRYTRFKKVYIVRFDARDIHGNPLIHSGTEELVLEFSRINKKTELVWCLTRSGDVVYQDITNPNILAYPLHCL